MYPIIVLLLFVGTRCLTRLEDVSRLQHNPKVPIIPRKAANEAKFARLEDVL
jgi:hypothetical protein